MKRPLKMMMMIRQEAEIYKLFLYDEIRAKEWTWDGVIDAETSARKVQETLADIPDGASIELHVNSNGGDAYQGVAIYNALKQKDAHITAYVDGLACSAATLPLMAAEKVIMGTGTNLLVHNMWTLAMGNAEDLRKAADDLDKMMESNRKIYLSKCNLTEDELIELMEKEEFLTPEESVEMGFADKVADDESDPDDPDDSEDPKDPEDPEGPDDPEGTDDPEEPEDPEKNNDEEDPDDEEDPEESAKISASQCADFLGTFF